MTVEVVSERAPHRGVDPHSQDPFVIGPMHLGGGAEGRALSGLRFAVKDLYDVEGTRTGVGNPVWLREASVADASAACVEVLLAQGAELVGKTVTDELALSLSGTNVHYGTPLNPRAPNRVPGGSSSGSVSAVAQGLVDFALGTDTGGSTRVPASYCGIYGLRTTHGRIAREGVFILAPSFCALGLFAGELSVIDRVLATMLSDPSPAAVREATRLLVVPELFDLADLSSGEDLVAAAERFAHERGIPLHCVERGVLAPPAEILNVFRTIQLYEAWELHGDWVSRNSSALGWGIAERFAAAAKVTSDAVREARLRRAKFQVEFAELFADGSFLLQPAASGPAPLIDLPSEVKDDLRRRTMMLTAPAGLAGAPALSLPLAEIEGLPVGLAVVGRPGDDAALVHLAMRGR